MSNIIDRKLFFRWPTFLAKKQNIKTPMFEKCPIKLLMVECNFFVVFFFFNNDGKSLENYERY